MKNISKTLSLATLLLASGILGHAAIAGGHNTKHAMRPFCGHSLHCKIPGHTQPTCKGPHKSPNGVMIQCD